MVEAIGERLKQLRVNKGYTQKQIGNECHVSQISISRYEQSTFDAPTEILLWYADFFHVSLDYIFGRTDKPEECLYSNNPSTKTNEDYTNEFLEMCFEPGTEANRKFTQAVRQAMKETKP